MPVQEQAEPPATHSTATVIDSQQIQPRSHEPRQRLVIVGFGMTAFKLVERLAALDVLERFAVTVVGEEPYPAYDRVHLTEWLEHGDLRRITLGRPDWDQAPGIRVLTGDAVTAIDRESCAVQTASGQRIHYDRLVLATGSAAHVPPIEGADAPGVFVYRTLDDIKKIGRRAQSVRAAIVVGGGLLGIEAADALRRRGLEVWLLESGEHFMRRQLDADAAARLEQCIAEKGIRTLKHTRAARIESRDGGLILTVVGREEQLTAGMIVIAPGFRPRDEVAREAGLAVAHPGGGVAVNDELRTSDIFTPSVIAHPMEARCGGW